jgi:adenylate cyclase
MRGYRGTLGARGATPTASRGVQQRGRSGALTKKKTHIVSEDEWRAYLEGTHRHIRLGRRTFGILPADPRCRFCSVPFGGPGGWVLGRLSESNLPWEKNPNLCRRCVTGMNKGEIVGAEVEISFLFVDVRRSSDLARRLGTLGFTQVMHRFYEVATRALFDNDGLLDKFVGDEVVGFFAPFVAGPRHAERAVDAARALFRSAGYGSDAGPWLRLGAGVSTGSSFVGFVPRGLDSEFTAFGDTINVAAHLAAQAGPGEILVTREVGAVLRAPDLESRHVSLKGHELDVLVMSVAERSLPEPVAGADAEA